MATPLSHIVELVNKSHFDDSYKHLLIEYSKTLEANGVPIIFDAFHLAYQIGIPPARLIYILRDRDNLYNTYKIRKKSGGYRWIMSPSDDLKNIQYWIKNFILDNISISKNANAFVKGKSIKDNAIKHIGQELILNIDLYRFFDTIKEKRVYGLFRNLGYTKKLSYDLARLITVHPPTSYWKDIKIENRLNKSFIISKPAILPQGAPTSPVMSNIIANRLDKIFTKCSLEYNLNYSRYADDITFSGRRKNMISLSTVKKVIRQQGFTININKTRYIGNSKKQTVTGLTVNNGVSVDKKMIKFIKQELYYCLKFGYKNHLEYKRRNGHIIKTGYKDWLFGKICFIYSINKNKGKRFLSLFEQIDWEI